MGLTVRAYRGINESMHVLTSWCEAGRNKLLINHLGRLFVTSDAATIIREIEVVHPAAKLLVMASQAQESEVRLTNRHLLYNGFADGVPNFVS